MHALSDTCDSYATSSRDFIAAWTYSTQRELVLRLRAFAKRELAHGDICGVLSG
jgi:hypothetical protein